MATWVAILIWAYDVGGATGAGLIAVVQLVPATLLAPVISQLGDRLRRDHALAIGFAVQSAAFLATAAALTFDGPSIFVYVTATLAAIGVSMTRPVYYATLPEISESPEQLTAANSLSSSTEGFGTFGGPLLTAGLLALSGPGAVFWLAGAAAAVAALLVRSLPLKSNRVQPERVSFLTSAVEGFTALKQSQGTGRVSMIFGSVFLVIGALDILTVVLGLELLRLGQSGPGTLASALGIGGLLGAAGTVVLVHRRRLAAAVAGGLIAFGVPLALISLLGEGLVSALVLLVVAGAGKAFVDVAGRTLLQRITPDWVLARVFGLQEAMMMGGIAIGASLAPFLVGWLGERGAFLVLGVLVALVGLTQWVALSRLDTASAMPGDGFDLLLAIPMFAVLDQLAVERLSREMERIEVPAGQAVITEGEQGDRFYVIEDGLVAILKSQSPSSQSPNWLASSPQPAEVNRLGPGSYFGETALLRDIPRTATVTAITDLVLYALDRRPFLEAVTRSSLSAGEAERVVDLRASNAESNLNAEARTDDRFGRIT